MNEILHLKPADGFPLTDVERQIWAHDQVGELGPFARPVLMLRFTPAHSGAALTAAAEAMILTHPAFATRLIRLPGGEMRRVQEEAARCVLHRHGPAVDPAAVAAEHLAALRF
ncbi:hypothetical protein, partial [Cypionkella sp.]|uniref:hypothetical protein n=1 Tax=Cypionkella sp. TaxID=2811411 RepID=UPI002ABAC8E2